MEIQCKIRSSWLTLAEKQDHAVWRLALGEKELLLIYEK